MVSNQPSLSHSVRLSDSPPVVKTRSIEKCYRGRRSVLRRCNGESCARARDLHKESCKEEIHCRRRSDDETHQEAEEAEAEGEGAADSAAADHQWRLQVRLLWPQGAVGGYASVQEEL